MMNLSTTMNWSG